VAHDKAIEFGQYAPTGEPSMQVIDRRDVGLRKYASADVESLEVLRTAPSLPGHTMALVLAMTAYEFYGFNRNGDGFHERKYDATLCDGRRVTLCTDAESLPAWHKTFETVGKNFLFHANKDPSKAVGRIARSIYNWKMHRVELIVAVDNGRADKIVQRLRDREYPAVSMGCRIPADVCVYCGNRAPTRAQYCIHVSGHDPRYGLGTILDSGIEMGVLNPCPELFDLSWVWKPADRVAYTMRHLDGVGAASDLLKAASERPYAIRRPGAETKVASVTPRTSKDQELDAAKCAALKKLSEIDKMVDGELSAAPYAGGTPAVMKALAQSYAKDFEPVGDDVIEEMARRPLRDSVATFSSMDMSPSADELLRLFSHWSGGGSDDVQAVPVGSIRRVILRVFGDSPDLVDVCQGAAGVGVGAAPGDASLKLASLLAPMMEKRALAGDLLMRKYVPENAGVWTGLVGGDPGAAYYGRAQQPLHATDPSTGDRYATTRNVAEQTDLNNVKHKALEAGVLAGATGIGVGAMSLMGRKNKALRVARWPVGAVGMGLAGYAGLRKIPEFKTDEGVSVPHNTPMSKMSAADTDAGLYLMAAAAGGRRHFAFEKSAEAELDRLRSQLVYTDPSGYSRLRASSSEFLSKVSEALVRAVRRCGLAPSIRPT